ncbi:MAG: SET domain-containing protein [Candidatus Parcubacteria bacterium]|nr:SET domain-containing protein [Candidatus Parcubacteria bacterium]
MALDKETLLNKIKNTYCRLRPSAVEGVGVFAIRDIPEGTDPFGNESLEWIKFQMDELKDLDEEILKLVDDFCVIEEDRSVYIPETGFNGMDISFFVNNSTTPNLKTIDGGEKFVTIRNIKKGEELTVAYSTYDYKYQ